jgi:hypothetical protein
MDYILASIKKLLGIQPEYKAFDDDIIIHIKTVFMILNQLGVGPAEGFSISHGHEKWSDYCTTQNENAVRTFVYLKVRLMFDPPTSSALMDSINNMLAELEWRLYLEGDNKAKGGDNNE